MEIGDIFVINKSDREGADRLYMDIKSALDMGFNTKDKNWKVPIIKVSALKDIGIDELFQAIIKHRDYIKESEKIIQMRKKRYYEEIEELIKEKLWEEFKKKNHLEKLVEEGFKSKKSPYELIREII